MHESEKWKGSHSVVSNSLRPHGLQPTRLLRPWDFPGRSTGVGCHCLRQKKKSCAYACRIASVVSDSLRPYGLWPARFLCQGGGFSRQEYWSVLANTGCHTLLEHCISCCPRRQLHWVPAAARTLETQAAAAPPHLALTRAHTQALQGSLRSKPQWTNHMQRWK